MTQPTTDERKQIAATIIMQLGGLGKLRAMIGATDFIALENGLQFSFKGNRKINKCVIMLDPMDTYTFQLWYIFVRNGNFHLVYELENVYNDMLISLFQDETGLDLSL